MTNADNRLKQKLVWLLISLPMLVAFAQGPIQDELAIVETSQEDLDGDGWPDSTIIDAAFVTDHDRIRIIDRAGDMAQSIDWRQATDFDNDVWLYDIGADGSVQLIVVYDESGAGKTASVYDDQDGDGMVSYEQRGLDIEVTESGYWTALITTDSTWFLPDGRPNLNAKMAIDGPAPFNRMPAIFMRDWMIHDGEVDAEFLMVADSNGIGHVAIKRLLTDSPDSWVFERTHLWGNEDSYSTDPHKLAFFPFLPAVIVPDTDRRYFDLPPRLNVDWLAGKVAGFELDGYPIGNGWHFNSNRYLREGVVNPVDFESPQAYYNFSEITDKFPELHIRVLREHSDPRLYGASYDWRLSVGDSLVWDYKIDVGGKQEIESLVEFSDYSIEMVPFADLPFWVTERDWAYGVLISREGEGYNSSEGIYEWYSLGGVLPDVTVPVTSPDWVVPGSRGGQQGYLTGTSSESPARYYNRIRAGFRGEYANLNGPALLYLNPIDRKMHLINASHGIWNVDGLAEVLYDNLNDDAFIDQWRYIVDGETVRQLNHTENHLVYAGSDQVLLKQVSTPDEFFKILPPRDSEEWREFRRLLEEHGREFEVGDFEEMVHQFTGLALRIEGAISSAFRPTRDGFRFVLELGPDFVWQSDLPVKGSDNLTPGNYLLQAAGQNLSILPLTPPDLTTGELELSFEGQEITTLNQVRASVLVQNQGLQDAQSVQVKFYAEQSDQRQIFADTEISVHGQDQQLAFGRWVPEAPGSWTIGVEIRTLDQDQVLGENIMTGTEKEVNITPLVQWRASDFVALDGQQPWKGLLVIFLALAIVLAGLTLFLLLLREASTSKNEDFRPN